MIEVTTVDGTVLEFQGFIKTANDGILSALENSYRGIVRDLAEKYEVKHNTISAIRNGRRPAGF